ncbi:FtsX-like permease family protein [Candidatus Gracilibacteria bacterium]|nr:FtsX-like permease family protein [Candidatus Gracilibacteria bacterium]NJS41639.1 FtsX-like permease family protein [Candidatus Gracilibacteria bacterium]
MIKHSFVGGFTNLIRSFWLSMTAISVLIVSLASVAFVASVSTVVGFSLRKFDQQISVLVYFKDEATVASVNEMIEDLNQQEFVKEVNFVDGSQAKDELSQSNNTASDLIEKLEGTEDELFLEYIDVSPVDSESYEKIVSFARDPKFNEIVDEVRDQQAFINQLQNIYRWTNIGGLALIIIFALVSMLVMSNILRITIFHRKNEIEIMRLVGATNNYIRGPFIVEGFYYNLIASLIVVGVFLPALFVLLPTLQEWLQLDSTTNTNALMNQLYLSIFSTIFVGSMVGVLTAFWATRKYLKL